MVSTDIPLIEELAEILGVNDDTISEWRKTYPEFSNAYDRLFRKQRGGLIRNGLAKSKGQVMNIFLLKANHGMIETEKRIQEIQATIYTELPDDQLDALIAQKSREVGAAEPSSGEGTKTSEPPTEVREGTPEAA